MSRRRVVAMIPVRGGSKGLPGKNVRPLLGKPLLAWSIEAALGCPDVEAVWVSSDDPQALAIAERHGARAHRRPAALASDTAPMGAVVKEFGQSLLALPDPPEAVMVMYATHPLRTPADVAAVYACYAANGGRPIIGVKQSHTHPYLYYSLDADGHPSTFCGIDPNQYYRRQDYPQALELTTFACVIPLGELEQLNAQLQTPRTFGMMVDADKTLDIDTIGDFELAEIVLQKRLDAVARTQAAAE